MSSNRHPAIPTSIYPQILAKSRKAKLDLRKSFALFRKHVRLEEKAIAHGEQTMQSDATHLFDQAMKLPLDEREALAEQLYLSLHPLAGPHEEQDAVDAAWSDEIGRRVNDIKSGSAATISAEEAHQKLRDHGGH